MFPSDPDDDQAAYMIDLLKLNVPFLKIKRAAAIQGVLQKIDLRTVNEVEIMRMAVEARGDEPDGSPTEFYHVITRYLATQFPA